MTTVNELHPGYVVPGQRAQAVAQQQGRPAYLVLGPKAQVCAAWPGVVCHRVHADGTVDCCVYCADPRRPQ